MSWKDDVWNVKPLKLPEPKTDYSHLTRKQVIGLRQNLRRDFPDDSETLFNSVWREILQLASNMEIYDFDQMKSLYESIVSYKVNNPRSKFYMYG